MNSKRNRRAFLQQFGLAGAFAAAAPSWSSAAGVQARGPANRREAYVADFSRSHIRWMLDTSIKPPRTVSRPLPMTLNRVRMPIEAIAVVTNRGDGKSVRFALGAECRTEQVWVKRDIWHLPNARMCMIAGENDWLIEKQWVQADFEAKLHPPVLGAQPERHVIDPSEVFAGHAVEVAQRRAVELEDIDEIIGALSGQATLVARSEYVVGGLAVMLEYPVKTCNFSERERYYQVDTGPILLPTLEEIDLKRDPLIRACRLAFVAHNEPTWAEFLVCVPTPVAEGVRVHHYSKPVRVEGLRNRLFSLG